MYEFYLWPAWARLCLTFFFAICVLFQTLSLIFSRYRHPRSAAHISESLLEASILLQILCLSLLHGQVYAGFVEGNIPPTGYGPLRIIAFLLVAPAALFAFAKTRKAPALLPLLAAPVILPAAEAVTGKAYPWFFILSLLLLFLRSVRLSAVRLSELRTGISELSVKEAVDNLHTGVLFCRPDGRILLISERMQSLMTQISGEAPRNGRRFYERLVSGHYDSLCGRAELEGQIVCIPGDGAAWMLTKADLTIKGKPYVQLTALDVTERWRLTAELRRQDDALRQKSDELKAAIANLNDLCREQETIKAKMRAHDVLGQRLTLLLRAIREETALRPETLKALSEGLLQELRTGSASPTPADQLDSLRQIFQSIGVSVLLEGSLPPDEERALLFVDIIRESITNAVRHGFATEVRIRSFIEHGRQGRWNLHITDNGNPAVGPVVEGGGLSGMRRKLEQSGGMLQVTQEPGFALSAVLPEAINYRIVM